MTKKKKNKYITHHDLIVISYYQENIEILS